MWSDIRRTSPASASIGKVRGGDEEVDAVELLAIGAGVGGQAQQRVQRDDRLGIRRALADDAGPGGVVQLGIGVGMRAMVPSKTVRVYRCSSLLPVKEHHLVGRPAKADLIFDLDDDMGGDRGAQMAGRRPAG